ncbi:hypothetical protein NQ314_017795 [Rhamnusium bicolor]|uniref:Uncharacterized protein n=1 Tax=Rhamnusium bicolor TaxID=1586634 RepID=A0AAV8WTI9_9CUCU|nr:hypothetical protein NQ314_017795 [Rhamnusium bicolor]
MLCGEFHRAPIGLHLNSIFISDNRSPYCSLLTLVRGMAAITAQAVHDDEDIFLVWENSALDLSNLTPIFLKKIVSENGLLSYENPNYHLGPSNRLDDALNSNTENVYEDIYQELDDICNMGHGVKVGLSRVMLGEKHMLLSISVPWE